MSGYGRSEKVSVDKAAHPGEALTVLAELHRSMSGGTEMVNEGWPAVTEMMTALAAGWAASDHMIGPYDTETLVVPICADTDAFETTVKRTLTVTAVELERLRLDPNFLIPRARAEFGGAVIGATPVSLPRARRAVAVATEGRAVTSYEIVTRELRRVGGLHPTQAAARAAAIDHVNGSNDYPHVDVRAVVTREDGNLNLVSISRGEPDTSDIVFNIVMSVPTARAKTVEWGVTYVVWS
jgi:hypothetical protein